MNLPMPKSIWECVPIEIKSRWYHPVLDCGNNYEFHVGIARTLQPRTIFEIGVLAGWSLCAFIAGHPDIEYILGWDCEGYWKKSNQLAIENISTVKEYVRSSVQVELKLCDSHQETFPERLFDLIHIDGDHSFEGALMDLERALGHCKWLLVDDYTLIPGVAQAVNQLIESKSPLEVTHFDSMNGMVLMRFQ